MVLYRVNGNYPDKNFRFTLRAADLNLAATSHKHDMIKVSGLTAALNAKAVVGHTHSNSIHEIYAEAQSDPEEYEGGIVSLSIEATSGSSTPTLSVSGNTVTITYNSPQTNHIVGMLNFNPQASAPILQLYNGTFSEVEDSDLTRIQFEGNTYA